MNYILTSLLAYLLLYRYLTLFLCLFFSAVLLPLPADTLLLAVGAFASQKYFNMSLSFFVAFIGNMAGDSVDYFLTWRYGHRVIKKLKLDKNKYFIRVEKYIRTHTGFTIFITRFVTSIGPLVNFLAGVSDISYKKFFVYDALGNLLNVLLFLVMGYIFGVYWQNFTGLIGTIGGIFFVTILVFIVRIFQKKI